MNKIIPKISGLLQNRNYLFTIIKTKLMSFLQEFKAFAMKGNVVDMAVGIIIGGAFGKIVTSW